MSLGSNYVLNSKILEVFVHFFNFQFVYFEVTYELQYVLGKIDCTKMKCANNEINLMFFFSRMDRMNSKLDDCQLGSLYAYV